jgi:dienelactone hydrolase
MTEVALFHHLHGLTPGVRDFAEALEKAGHTVHTPDLYDGHVFETFDEGLAYAKEIGFGTFRERGKQAVADLPGELVYAGFSLGAMPAQMLAQTRPGAVGALLFHACVPAAEFGGPWPSSVPVQVHGMDADELFVEGGDLDAARELLADVADAELFLYPGDRHFFADRSLPDYDGPAAALLTERVLAFLDRVRGS